MRKLRSEHGGANSVRHERPLARPRKQVVEGDIDDEPTYVVEGSQDTLSKQEYDDLVREEVVSGDGGSRQQKSSEASTSKQTPENGGKAHLDNSLAFTGERAAAIGGARKKRTVTAIGADDNGEDKTSGKTKPREGKKGKKVKLSFDEE